MVMLFAASLSMVFIISIGMFGLEVLSFDILTCERAKAARLAVRAAGAGGRQR